MLYCTFTTEQLQQMSLLEKAIELLAPPECISCGAEGSAVCVKCINYIEPFGERCWRCSAISAGYRTCKSCRRRGSVNRVWVATDYVGIATDLVKKYKFGQLREASKPMASVMAKLFMQSKQRGDFVLVPVPTATSRVRQRGFDHTALLASELQKILGLEIYSGLRRTGQSRQVGARRELRQKQLGGQFFLISPNKIKGRSVIIVDDVVTTGSTLEACSRTLRQNGAHRVDALVFAKRL